jgi:hypothetical protein
MAITFSASQFTALQNVLSYYQTTGEQLPLDANAIDQLALVSGQIGYLTAGGFKDGCANAPVTTLLGLIMFVGHP